MNPKNFNLSLLIIICLSSNILAQKILNPEKTAIEISDIQNMLGTWTGTLTYLDYTSNNPYTMPCGLVIKTKKENRKLNLYYTYPNEPKANSKGKLKISKDKFRLNGKTIISRSTLSDETTQIVTRYSNKDGNDRKKALIRNSYIIGIDKLIIRKEVQFEGTTEWLKRNEFNFNRG